MKNEIFTRNIEDIIVRSDLEKKLKSGKKLRIKFGVDPTNKDIHIGRAVVLWKLKVLQEAGHKIILIIGDFTATIGDTSDKDSERQPLSKKQVEQNMKDYLSQIGNIIDLKKAEVCYNSKWLDKLKLSDFFKLAEKFTVSQMLERENYKLRFKSNKPIGIHEILYPVLQGYDSVMVKSDIEIGGTDQLFNMLAGREIQKYFKQKPQSVITMHLLEGTDGRKMSSSWGNCIYISDSALDIYGKVMTIKDELAPIYFKMCTDMPMSQIEQIEKDLANGDNPRDSKASLAWHIVSRYYGEKIASESQLKWENQFVSKQFPEEIEEVLVQKSKPQDILVKAFEISLSELKRISNQGGLRINHQKIKIEDIKDIYDGDIVQLGKLRYKKISYKK